MAEEATPDLPVRARSAWRRMLGPSPGKDLLSGTVLGVQSVPDGLAAGLLAGVNPLAGMYAYLFGMVGAAVFTSTPLLTVQATGAMALVVADAELDRRPIQAPPWRCWACSQG